MASKQNDTQPGQSIQCEAKTMALRGSLLDLGIIDLLQFPNSGRKTGLLSIRGVNGEAKLYYVKGKLVHAELGNLSSMDALVELSDWSEGEFEFHIGMEPNQTSIEMDLHRLVMMVLKIRDERAQSRKSTQAPGPSGQDSDAALIHRQLEKFRQNQSHILYAGMLDPDGNLIAEANGANKTTDEIRRLQTMLQAFMGDYPRSGIKRIFIDDDTGFVVGARLAGEKTLLLVVDHNPTLGTVALSLSRLTDILEKGNPI